jgi:hypothetical protein
MKKIVLTNLVALLSFLTSFNLLSQTAVAPSGTGTACDPYQIGSLDNLYWITQNTASWASGKYFVQIANIDATATSTYFSNGSGGYYGLPTIGSYSNQLVGNQLSGWSFSANYDGRNYSIDNLYINRSPHYVALFGQCNNATIKNLVLNSPSIYVGSTGGTISNGYSGNSIFMASGSGTFDNIKVVNGVLSVNSWFGYVGGMFGRTGSINASNCSLNATISVTSSYNGSSGGFIGYSESSTSSFINCYSSGSFSSSNLSIVGGFAGSTYAGNYTFNKCYSTMNVSCNLNGGGFIGQIYDVYCSISNCYSTGSVTSSNAGGFFGISSSGAPIITNCYATGTVSGTNSGGFGGNSSNTIILNNCFWDTQTSTKNNAFGTGSPSSALGKTTAEMKTQSTFSSANWDFSNVWGMSSLVNNNYPNLTFPTITLIPLVSGVNPGTISANQVVCYNASPANIILSNSCGSIQWQSSTDNTTWTNISGAISATLTAAQMGVSTLSRYFRAVLTGNSNTAYSSVVSVKVNNGLDFDGTSDFVTIGNHASLNFLSNFSIESWVKVPATPKSSINAIFSKNYPNLNTPGYMFGFNNWNSSDLKLVFEPGLGAITSDRPIIAGAWNHVAVVVSGNGTFATFYINGTPAGSSSITLTDASSVDEFIGSMTAGGMYSLSGTLDELRIWNVARSQQELIDNMDNSLVGNETGLVAYYDFNQGVPAGTNTGLTVKDQTVNGINGTINGITLSGSVSNFVDGNHLSIISPETTACFGSSSPKIIVGGAGKSPSSFQWYSNSSASTSGASSISGATSSSYNAPTTSTGTIYYYAIVNGTCASSTTTNFSKVIIEGNISGNDYLYLGNTGTYTSTDAPAASNPWVISNTSFATTSNTGVLTAVASGTTTLTYTPASGCVATKNITVVPTTWKGTTSSDWNTGSNWNGLYVPTTVTNLIFDNAAVNDLNLDQNRTLTSLTFGSGSKKINLGNYNLTLSTFSGNSATRFIKTSGTGQLKQTLANNASAIFPIGNSAYNPLTITNKSGASDVFAARVVDGAYMEGLTGAAITSTVLNRTWDISKTNANAGSGVDFVFNWNAGEVANGSFTSPKMNHYSSTTSNWEVPTVTSTTVGSNALTVVGYTGTFSPFTIAEGSSALPVELTAFNANCTENTTTINWQTASEHNSASFDVEKSRDGANWSVIKTLAAAGNSTTTIDYSVVDSEKSATIVYYRLNQIDQDGVSKIYGPISATCGGTNDFTAIVYPNPAAAIVTVEMNSPIAQTVSIQICGTDGKAIVQMATSLEEGTTQIPLSIETLKAGVYSVQVNGENATNTIKLVVQ